MGIKYAWSFLSKKGLRPSAQKSVSLTSTDSKIRVDVCSTFYSSIKFFYSNPSDLSIAHANLERLLLKTGETDKTRFYIDGMPATEKSQTHAFRHKNRQDALVKAAATISDLESRLTGNQRIRKHHVATAYKNIRQGFFWSFEQRASFVQYMTEKGYDIVLCPTESDVLIATECQAHDAVISGDSDLLFYKTVPVVWRPIGSYKSRRFVPFEKSSLLKVLNLTSTQLTALAILSGNDYVLNIPHLAIATNHKIVRTLDGGE